MLSQTAEYALRAVVCLAQEVERPLTADALADLTGVPRGYLSKVMRQLGRAGIVASHRGPHGGFVLTRAATEVTVLDVVDSIDALPSITSCPLGRPGHGVNLCPLHHTLQQVNGQAQRVFAATTLAALTPGPNAVSPLCETAAPDAGEGASFGQQRK